VALCLCFFCKLVGSFSQVDRGSPGNISLGFGAKVSRIGVGGEKKLGTFSRLPEIPMGNKEGMQNTEH
jgi:hypothetical protein